MQANPVVRTVDAASHGVQGAYRVYTRLPRAKGFSDVCENLVAASYFGWTIATSFLLDEEPLVLSVPDQDDSYFEQEKPGH